MAIFIKSSRDLSILHLLNHDNGAIALAAPLVLPNRRSSRLNDIAKSITNL